MPLAMPKFDEEEEEEDDDSLNGAVVSENNATFSWDGLQQVQSLTNQNHLLQATIDEQHEKLEEYVLLFNS